MRRLLMSALDEAFALLMIDNYQEHLILAKMKKEDKTTFGKTLCSRKGKYTSAKSGNRELRGWSKDGLLDYGR